MSLLKNVLECAATPALELLWRDGPALARWVNLCRAYRTCDEETVPHARAMRSGKSARA